MGKAARNFWLYCRFCGQLPFQAVNRMFSAAFVAVTCSVLKHFRKFKYHLGEQIKAVRTNALLAQWTWQKTFYKGKCVKNYRKNLIYVFIGNLL